MRSYRHKIIAAIRGINAMSDSSSDVKKIIEQRQNTHGDFRKVSSMSQQLCIDMQSGVNWDTMPDHFREGLEMIQHKIARILSGDPHFAEHWLDIAGYATRVRTIIEEDTTPHV
jgi:hypothetical protein